MCDIAVLADTRNLDVSPVAGWDPCRKRIGLRVNRLAVRNHPWMMRATIGWSARMITSGPRRQSARLIGTRAEFCSPR